MLTQSLALVGKLVLHNFFCAESGGHKLFLPANSKTLVGFVFTSVGKEMFDLENISLLFIPVYIKIEV